MHPTTLSHLVAQERERGLRRRADRAHQNGLPARPARHAVALRSARRRGRHGLWGVR